MISLVWFPTFPHLKSEMWGTHFRAAGRNCRSLRFGRDDNSKAAIRDALSDYPW
jgi:hypothetical protein